MKSNTTRITTTELSKLTDRIEKEFFRIERENRWLASAINGLIAGAAVGFVAWLVTSAQEGDLLLFACLGSSAASVVFAPLAKTNSLRAIITAYGAASLICLALFPLRIYQPIPLAFQCFLAVSLSVFLMRLLDAMHPAAIGSALAFIIYDRNVQSLLILMLAILGLLTIVKLLAYVYLEDLTFQNFHREFRHDYYGKEMTLTLEDDVSPAEESCSQHGRVNGLDE